MDTTITITFGECVENHAGMQQIGNKSNIGLSVDELKEAKTKIEQCGVKVDVELIHLNQYNKGEGDEAAILIIRQGANALLHEYNNEQGANALLHEYNDVKWDTKAKMKGRVVNKRARFNICMADESQTANYEEGKGTVVSFDDLPLTKKIRALLPLWFGEKTNNLNAEGNYYYNNNCFIGFHGDFERRIVVAIRLGKSMPLYYQWYHHCKPVGERCDLMLHHGDMYIMSDKAVGHDWKKSSLLTLRHAANYK
ncbi:MAG TPA: hypothetical protein VLG50_07895 [Candidatus Saccharimonadales bacterium]|nr:hypothetical protein [Candidatus Saccharimonadales bacterium]